MLKDLKLAQEMRKTVDVMATNITPGPSIMSMVRWQKPALDIVTYIVDASFSSSHNQVGIGMCIRNTDGCFVLAKTAWFALLCSVDVGEALGLCQALQWVVELGFHNTDFSMDSKIFVDAFNGNNSSNNDFGSIIGPCRRLFSIIFINS